MTVAAGRFGLQDSRGRSCVNLREEPFYGLAHREGVLQLQSPSKTSGFSWDPMSSISCFGLLRLLAAEAGLPAYALTMP